jgi:large subunit ribosomal protein L30e
MAAKNKEVDEKLNELKVKLQDGKVVIGVDRVMKELRAGHLSKVLLASNARKDLKDDLTYYAKLSSIPVIELSLDNEELGVFCKKNFFVSTIGLQGE